MLRTGPSTLLRADLDRVRSALAAHYESEATRQTYAKGLAKLAEYLRLRCGEPAPEKQVNWGYYLDPLPALAGHRRAGLRHPPAAELAARRALPGYLHAAQPPHPFVRWMVEHVGLTGIDDPDPHPVAGLRGRPPGRRHQPITLNRELARPATFCSASWPSRDTQSADGRCASSH